MLFVCLGVFGTISLLLVLCCLVLLFSGCSMVNGCVGIWFGLAVLDVVFR